MSLSRFICMICLAAFLHSTCPQSADACPMCQAANEDGELEDFAGDPSMTSVPRAYMFSILFMLAVPVGLATSFGVGFYRLSRQTDADSVDDVG